MFEFRKAFCYFLLILPLRIASAKWPKMTSNPEWPPLTPALKDMNWSPHPRGRVGSAGVPTQTRPELWRTVPGRNNGKETPVLAPSPTPLLLVVATRLLLLLLCPKKHSILSVTNQVLLVLSICIFPVCLSSHVYPIQNNLIRRRYGPHWYWHVCGAAWCGDTGLGPLISSSIIN